MNEIAPLRLQWTGPYRVFGSPDHLAVRGMCGAYRIRALDENGKPIAIARLAGVDPQGILHIGKSVRLGNRIRMFRQAAEGLKAAHQGGKQYRTYDFARTIPPERLWYDYAISNDEAEALRWERALHLEYRRTFLDRPPLDGTSGQECE